MVEISFLGHSGVRICGKKVSLVCDPPNGQVLGIPTPKKKVLADIVLLTQKEVAAHSNLEIVEPANSVVFPITGPGEYEISQTEITGIATNSKGACFAQIDKLTIYQIKISGVSLVFLGTIAKLTQNLVEQIAACDILFLPVGGKVSIEPKEAVGVITSLEPKIVIPIHYAQGEQDGLAKLEQFLNQVGKIRVENLEKLQITTDKLPEEVKIVTFTNG